MDLDAVADQILALLEGVPGLDVFDGEPQARMDSDGRAHPYAAVYVTPGTPVDRALAAYSGHVVGWQVTAAGGDAERCRRAVDRVRAGLVDQWITVGGVDRQILELEGYDPGPMRVDQAVTPPRSWVPLFFEA